jgi:RNA polymerase sigma-70 factor (ECF subfamily)
MRVLRLHCYRLVGSLDDAEDMAQETLTRAWRHIDRLTDPDGLRPWLFRIATNACLDLLDRRRRDPATSVAIGDDWPDPIPDGWPLGDRRDGDPAAVAITNERIDLAFLTAVQRLPPRQRAILVLRDVLEWPASDVAEALDLSEAAVHSAVRRARRGIQDENAGVTSDGPDAWEIARRYRDAWRRADMTTLASLLAEDARMAMPPDPRHFEGRPAILSYLGTVLNEPPEGRISLRPTRANGGPAFIVLSEGGRTGTATRLGVKVLVVRDGLIVEIRGYMRVDLAERFAPLQ